MTILLSVNAVAILVAGVLIASAIGLTGNEGLKVVSERSDEVDGSMESPDLLTAGTDGSAPNLEAASSGGEVSQVGAGATISSGETTDEQGRATSGNVPHGELWNEKSITIYQSADKDICIDSSLPGYNNMYWQTSNKSVISGFYNMARADLGGDVTKCRYPLIVGVGTTTITAGTYDGARRDTIEVIVKPVPVDDWKNEVLNLVNEERRARGIAELSAGGACQAAAFTRVSELKTSYSHTRPDGTNWVTVCTPAKNQYSGENVAAGANVASPRAVVRAWMNSDSHRANILNSNYKYLSVGFEFDANAKYKTYWTQIFTSW
ncbi:MAG: CAP domain-containing protein [Candidatus Saccharibacteria bacterium]|nr:CAP domain-containing protein [Candidatus Saccharibacteria bacterium]